MFDLIGPHGDTIKSPPNGWRWSKETIAAKMKTGEIRFTPDGKGIRRRTYLRDMKGLPPSTMWMNLDETGHNRQAKYELKALFPDRAVTDLFGTPKPERLLAKILSLATEPGDLVLDSFAGSGTTGAVAHKMGRRWIMVEVGEHCRTDIIPRLHKVIDGADPSGATEAAGWKGGGGFRYYRLAPSLLEKDHWGNWVINKQYNATMLAEALCKIEGFIYAPSDTLYWQHGYSTERDFIYVTTAHLNHEQLQQLSEEVGPARTLLVLCTAFRGKADRYPNLTVKKIPKQVLSRCEWGHDDYSLRVENLPKAPPKPGQQVLFAGDAAS
jgi:adenine-specific DNA-methyltransferase